MKPKIITHQKRVANLRVLRRREKGSLLCLASAMKRLGLTNSECLLKAAKSGDLTVAHCYIDGRGAIRYLFTKQDIDAWEPRPRGWHGQDAHRGSAS